MTKTTSNWLKIASGYSQHCAELEGGSSGEAEHHAAIDDEFESRVYDATPDAIWEMYVGAQSVREFCACCETTDWAAECAEYVRNVDTCTGLTEDELDVVADKLVAHIER